MVPRRRALAGAVATAADARKLSVATHNVESLAPSDPAAEYERLADGVVTNLAAPDIAPSRRSRTTTALATPVRAAHVRLRGRLAVLDHILVTRGVDRVRYAVVNIDGEYADQVSDHDPQVMRMRP